MVLAWPSRGEGRGKQLELKWTMAMPALRALVWYAWSLWVLQVAHALTSVGISFARGAMRSSRVWETIGVPHAELHGLGTV